MHAENRLTDSKYTPNYCSKMVKQNKYNVCMAWDLCDFYSLLDN